MFCFFFCVHQTDKSGRGSSARRLLLLLLVVTVMMLGVDVRLAPATTAATQLPPLPPRPSPLSAVGLVVFHQFFQSSIDSGLCISEARALWRWL